MKYDPERYSAEWAIHMNSKEVVESHLELENRIAVYLQKKRDKQDEYSRE